MPHLGGYGKPLHLPTSFNAGVIEQSYVAAVDARGWRPLGRQCVIVPLGGLVRFGTHYAVLSNYTGSDSALVR
jgi:hypothetical protein